MLRIKTDDEQDHGTVLIDVNPFEFDEIVFVHRFYLDFEIIRTKIREEIFDKKRCDHSAFE